MRQQSRMKGQKMKPKPLSIEVNSQGENNGNWTKKRTYGVC